MGRTGTTPAGSSNRSRYKNAFINGGFDFWQRGTNFVQPNAYTADRWLNAQASNLTSLGWAFSGTQVAAAANELPPTSTGGGNTYFYRTFINAVGTTPAASDYQGLFQKIENVNSFSGKTITISFLAKSSIANQKINVSPLQAFGTGGSTTATFTGKQLTLTSSWARYSATLSVPSVAGKTIGADSLLQIGLIVCEGATDAAGYGNTAITPSGTGTIDIAQVMVNEGDFAAPFSTHGDDMAQERIACQRYTQVIFNQIVTMGVYVGGSLGSGNIEFPVTMRKTPSAIGISLLDRNNFGTATYNSIELATYGAGLRVNINNPQNTYGSMFFSATFDAEL